MEIDAIAPAHGGVVRFGAAEQAHELALAKKAVELQDKGLQVSLASPNVTTSAAFSPSIYAQAAQYQLYTQSGTLASMIQGVAPVPPSHDETEEIHAVEGAQGATVDTLA